MRTKKVSLLTLLCVITACYVLFIIWAMYQLSQSTVQLYEGPYLISREARQMKTRLYEMRATLPFLLSTPDVAVEDIREFFRIQKQAQDQSMALLVKKSGENLEDLHHTMELLRQARRDTVAKMLGKASFEEVNSYYDANALPYHRQVLKILDHISEEADLRGDDILRNLEIMKALTIIFTLGMGLIIISFTVFVNKREQIQNKSIRYREALFNLLSQHIDDVFFISRSNGEFEYISTNSEKLLGYPASSILKDNDIFYNLCSEEDKTWLRETLGDNSLTEAVDRNISFVGDDRKFSLRVHPILQNNKVERYITVLTDQTRALALQQTLSDALENARRASAAKSEFLSHMSHEIRTPMNAIIGMTTIALSKLDDAARVEDCLSKIALSSKILLQIINDVLDMSKIEGGKLAINNEPFDFSKSVQSIVDIIQPQAKKRDLNFEISLVHVGEEELRGDPLRLHQILLNLLSNALKFTPAGGSIRLEIQQLPPRHNNVTIRFIVRDTGIGMSAEFLHKLYLPFEQATSDTATKYGGTGLGMAITKNLISLLGGTIAVKSEEGKGTEFTVELPYGLTGRKRAHDLAGLDSLKIMVVDDDRATCEHAALLLDNMGMQVQWVLSGAEAVENVRQAHERGDDYDVCFIDWKMPEMDGEETARRIRQIVGPDTLVIIISAYDWSSIEEQARAAGVSAFVSKPFFASTLYNALVSVTHSHGGKKEGAPAEKELHDFSGKRILLVEDNEFNREVAQEFLEMTGAEVESAVNGKDAVDKFTQAEAGRYDIILMDVQMPVMGGYEATRAIRASSHPDARSIPILAMTANAFNEDIAAALEAGMNDHISKPIDVKNLYGQLEKYLNRQTDRPAQHTEAK